MECLYAQQTAVVSGGVFVAGAIDAVVCEHHAYGGAGAAKLGEAVISACKQKVDFKFLYDLNQSIKVSMAFATSSFAVTVLYTVP